MCVRDEEECLYLMDTTDTDEREDVLRYITLYDSNLIMLFIALNLCTNRL